MMRREKFKPGAKRPRAEKLELDNNLFSGKEAPKIHSRFDDPIGKDEVLTKSLFARDIEVGLLESIKDIVYTERMSNNLQANQSSVITEALKLYIQNYDKEILPRPAWIKEQENKKSKNNR